MSSKSPAPLPEIFFDYGKGNYIIELQPGRFVRMSGSDIKNQLLTRGINCNKQDDLGLSEGDRLLAKSQCTKYVDYAGPLAGYKSGFYLMAGNKRVLVTESTNPVAPGKSAKMPFIETFFGQLLDLQEEYFYSWLKLRWQTLRAGVFAPSQLLVLAGPAGCGKTFAQWIITQLLGGRSAKPYAYMTGTTNFNEDLAEAEHLVMGDEEASYDIRTRKKFAARIKQMCVEPEMWIQGKGKKAITLETRRTLTHTVNDEGEHLLVIPPLDSDMAGKITLLRCFPATCLEADRAQNQKRVFAELPALARHLKDWKMNPRIKDDRFGVKSFHEKSLLEFLTDSAPEQQLLVIIDDVIFGKANSVEVWQDSAESLKVELLNSRHAATINRLLDWPAATGTYLARLANKLPNRFTAKRSNGKNSWLIKKEK